MTRLAREKEFSMTQPPSPNVKPVALVGRIVQIALGGTDSFRPSALVPPLKVVGWAYEKMHFASLEPPARGVCFVGVPLQGFENPVRADPQLLRATGIRFNSRMPLFQPHFLIDERFMEYFKRSEDDVIPVEVFDTDSERRFDEEFIADEYNFSHVGEGVMQLFETDGGFQKPWPRHFPWLSELKAVEEWLLAKCAGDPSAGR